MLFNFDPSKILKLGTTNFNKEKETRKLVSCMALLIV